MASKEERSVEHQAKRLREVMRNRFSQTIAEKLVNDFGGEQQALDFLLNENQDDVRAYLHETPEYIENIRKDSQNLESILKNGFEFSMRMFGCGACTRTWWNKVPIRKEISQCSRCKLKYDPIPKDKEWGWGKFICDCGNEFTSFAIMGETQSVCYKCNLAVPVDHILPPRRREKTNKSRAPHSCNGTNCFNRDEGDHYGNGAGHVGPHGHAFHQGMQQFNDQFGGMSLNNNGCFPMQPGAYPGPAPAATCIHPKSQKPDNRKLRWTSQRHRSTGSTVTDILSQGSLDDATVATDIALCTIHEL